MYTLIKFRNETLGVSKEENGMKYSIPFDPVNTDYQAYLKWVSEGNTPEQADNV